MTDAEQFLCRVLADRAAKHGELTYQVIAPLRHILDVAVRDLIRALEVRCMAMVAHRAGRQVLALEVAGARIEFFSGRDFAPLFGIRPLDGYWLIAADNCPAGAVDQCRCAAGAVDGWSMTTDEAA